MLTFFRSRRWMLGIVAILLGFGFVYRWWNPPVSTLLASARRALDTGDAPTALSRAQGVLAQAPDSIPAQALIAEVGYLLGDTSLWEPIFQQLEQSHPDETFALWLKLGSIEMQRFRAASAERALRRANQLKPDRPEPWRLLVQLISIQGRTQETTECLLALIRLDDFTREDLQLLAWPNSAVNDPNRLEQLLHADPDNRLPLLAHVGIALNENRAADAEQLLNAILERHPHHPRTIAILGRLLAERDAPTFLDWQRQLSPHAAMEPEAWLAQGYWLRNHGQLAAAANGFHTAVELDPRHQNALTELGSCLQAMGESVLATEFLDHARLHQDVTEFARRINESRDPENWHKLIERLEQGGRYWEAWGWCRDFLREFPGDATVQQNLIRIQNRLTPELPRTDPVTLPGKTFAWSSLAKPNWEPPAIVSSESKSTVKLKFEEQASNLGIQFRYENGPPHGKTMLQTSGGGIAAVDYDRDGWCDLYFTQGRTDFTATAKPTIDALFRNRTGIDFENVSKRAGLYEDRFSQGVAAGDIDNDGFPDLYVANWGQNRLWHNNGDGTFTDITVAAGLNATGWTTSTAIADFNGDGFPELFSVRYAAGEDLITRVCRDASGRDSVCRPTVFPAETDLIAINIGDGRFIEQCAEAGLDLPEGRGFGIVAADFNGDHRLDAFIANDQTANYLLIQDGIDPDRVHFTDEALVSGVAFDRDGYPQACMGVASGDVNHDGLTDLFITNFEDESDTLYLSQPQGGYLDQTRSAGLRDPTFKPLGFGTQFLDADLDGTLDLVMLNGHINDTSDIGKSPALLPQLFQGLRDGRFAQVLNPEPSDFFRIPRVGRGLCVLDWNRDGRPDFAGSFLDRNAALGTNHCESRGNWIAVEFVGVRSSRDAVGTKVRLVLDDGTTRFWNITAGDGFAASNQRRQHLGLGQNQSVRSMEIRWPSGETQQFHDVRGNMEWVIVEGSSHPREIKTPPTVPIELMDTSD